MESCGIIVRKHFSSENSPFPEHYYRLLEFVYSVSQCPIYSNLTVGQVAALQLGDALGAVWPCLQTSLEVRHGHALVHACIQSVVCTRMTVITAP